MSIKRLAPTVKNLGSLRLWREDLAGLVALAEKLENVSLSLEANDCELTDLEADLPELGARLRYFTLTATRAGGAEALAVRLSRSGSKVEATDPDLQTRAVISSIDDFAAAKRTLPLWFPYVSRVPAQAANPDRRVIVAAILFAVCAAWTAVAIVLVAANIDPHRLNATAPAPLPFSLGTGIPAALITITLIVSSIRARTLLFTGTRVEAPTFWQKNGATILISVAIAAVFYVLGILTHG